MLIMYCPFPLSQVRAQAYPETAEHFFSAELVKRKIDIHRAVKTPETPEHDNPCQRGNEPVKLKETKVAVLVQTLYIDIYEPYFPWCSQLKYEVAVVEIKKEYVILDYPFCKTIQ